MRIGDQQIYGVTRIRWYSSEGSLRVEAGDEWGAFWAATIRGATNSFEGDVQVAAADYLRRHGWDVRDMRGQDQLDEIDRAADEEAARKEDRESWHV